MCGIAGILVTHRKPDDPSPLSGQRELVETALNRMVERLKHRGPDDWGRIILSTDAKGFIGLGHTRLAILDISSAGHQPMATGWQRTMGKEQPAYWMTFNGEIYNFRQLRCELEQMGERFTSQSDTEVILKLYARYGRDCLHRLRGMFAFAIWDAVRQELFLARDRMGIKPLYCYVGKGFFLFASEVRALLASEFVPRVLDEVALWEYLAYQSVPAPRTMIRGVCALQPGSCLIVSASGEVCEERYWDMLRQAAPEARTATKEESQRRVGELLREAVALHLVSDVPVAAFLSGGIDSSAVVALMRAVGQTPKTFSVVFAERAYDEADYAKRVAKHVHADHTEIHLKQSSLLDQLPDALAAMDQPTGDGINTYVVSRAVSHAGLKVALSGLGGDELFAGYPSFFRLAQATYYLKLWRNLPKSLRLFAAKMVGLIIGPSVVGAKMAAILKSDGTVASVFPILRQVLLSGERRALLSERILSIAESVPDPYVSLLQNTFAGTQANILSQISYAEARTYMHDLLLRDTDQMSMAHALEVRVPFLDHKLVEYIMGLPDGHKRLDGGPKPLLRRSVGGLLPYEVVHRPKQGFALPFDLWMRGALRKYCEERLSDRRIGSRGLFRPDRVQALWEDFLVGRRTTSWSRLWILVVLEEWLERNGIECGE